MARSRMYLFERAYVDYGSNLGKFIKKAWHVSGDIWDWFWEGKGAKAIEIILRILIVLTTIYLCWLYVQDELAHDRNFSFGTFITLVVIGIFVWFVLWGWKPSVHFVARVVSGFCASGLILLVSLVTFAIAVIFFLLYLLILFLLTASSFIIFLPMRAAHSLWLLYRRIAYRCPYDDCAYQGLPIHICECGHRYNDLKPSFYGIFHHTCQHSNKKKIKLPTMDFLGRKKLPRLCGGCQRPLIFSSIGELKEWPIAIVGGPGVGKTLFLRQAILQLKNQLGAIKGNTISIDSDIQKRELENDFKILNRGQVLPKTAGNVMQAFGIALNIPKRLRCLLYLFDAPGEDFLIVERLGRKQVIQHIAGIVLLVDPFSLPLLSNHHQFSNIEELKASQTPFQRIIEVLIAVVNQMLLNKPTDRCHIPLAVVLSKADAFPKNDFQFLHDLYQSPMQIKASELHFRCRQAMEQLGAGRSIFALEQKFINVHYFVSSSLGRMPDRQNTSPFEPYGIIDPVLWLLGLKDAKIDLH